MTNDEQLMIHQDLRNATELPNLADRKIAVLEWWHRYMREYTVTTMRTTREIELSNVDLVKETRHDHQHRIAQGLRDTGALLEQTVRQPNGVIESRTSIFVLSTGRPTR